VVGYSVKAKGIARDIFGTDENYVLPVQSLQSNEALLKAFKWLVNNENMVRKNLNRIMPDYKKRVYAGVEALKKL